MAKNKLIRFDDIKSMDCVFEPDLHSCMSDTFDLKGHWRKNYFKNENPIIVELGCGKGEYAVELAKLYPDKNFVGIDIKGSRIWYGANEVRESNLKNVAFIRSKVDFIHKFFDSKEVDEIWLTFSDPQLKKPRKRLSSDLFIERYRKILKDKGRIHLKTDNSVLFAFTLDQISLKGYKLYSSSWDLHSWEDQCLNSDVLKIKTHYEQIFMDKGFDIKYCCFSV